MHSLKKKTTTSKVTEMCHKDNLRGGETGKHTKRMQSAPESFFDQPSDERQLRDVVS